MTSGWRDGRELRFSEGIHRHIRAGLLFVSLPLVVGVIGFVLWNKVEGNEMMANGPALLGLLLRGIAASGAILGVGLWLMNERR